MEREQNGDDEYIKLGRKLIIEDLFERVEDLVSGKTFLHAPEKERKKVAQLVLRNAEFQLKNAENEGYLRDPIFVSLRDKYDDLMCKTGGLKYNV